MCVLLSKNEPKIKHTESYWSWLQHATLPLWRKTRTYVHQKKYYIQEKILNVCMLQYIIATALKTSYIFQQGQSF